MEDNNINNDVNITNNLEENTTNNIEQVNNQNVVIEKPVKPKKKHRFLKFLLIVFIIVLLIIGFKYVRRKINERSFKKEVLSEYLTYPIEDLTVSEEMLDLDLANDGLTVKRKQELGLNPFDIDTDGDGLSDSSELKEYHSDPKKYSTSGDMLSDAYKVANNLDINIKYNELPVIESGNEKIKLTAKRVEDIEAVYREYTGIIPNDIILAMKPFRIYSFKGSVTLSVDNPDNYEVYSYDNLNDKAKKLKIHKDNNQIVFDIPNDNPILVCYKLSVLDDMIASNKAVDIYNYGNNVKKEYVAIALPIFNYLFKLPVFVYEVTDNNHAVTSNTVLENDLNKAIGGKFSVKVSTLPKIAATILDKIFDALIGNIHEPNKGFTNIILIYKHLYSYSELTSFIGISASEKETASNDNKNEDKEKDDNEVFEYEFDKKWTNTKCEYCADSGFILSKNSLNFANPTTTIGEDGICMGMASLVADTYEFSKGVNYKLNPKYVNFFEEKAFSKFLKGDLYSYNIVTDELMAYSDDIPGNASTLDSKTLKNPDGHLISHIESLYDFGNIAVNNKSYKFKWAFNKSFKNSQTLIKGKAIDKLRDYLNKGHVAIAGFLGDGQHAVNVYKMTEDKEDKDIIYLKIYDNNYKNDTTLLKSTHKRTKIDASIKLKRIYKKNVLTKKDDIYYLYEYSPFASYNIEPFFGSISGGTDYILFMDNNYNLLEDLWVIN